MIYYILYFSTKVLSWLCFPYKAHETRNIPRQGGFILASNHMSNLDPMLLGVCSVRRINFMAKVELFKGVLGFFLSSLGAFPVKRGESDLGAMREALRRLKEGRVILIFVEGTRRIGNQPSKAQAGVLVFSHEIGCSGCACLCSRNQIVMAPGTKFFKRGPVSATFGKPFFVSDAPTYEVLPNVFLDKIYALA